MQNDEKILIEAGLSEEQSLVYGSLLDRGPQKASILTSWLGIKRGLVYKVLEQLESMGLVEKKGGAGTVAVFSPLHPNKLLDIIDARAKSILLTKETLTYSLGGLASKFNLLTGKPNVLFYEGMDGLKSIYADVLAEKKDILLIRSPFDNKYPEIVPIVTKQIKDQVNKGIHTKAITPVVDDTKVSMQQSDKESLVERRLIPLADFNEPAQILIYGAHKVAITSFNEKMISTIIDDPAIHGTFVALFNYIWSKADKDNEYIMKSLGLQNTPPTL